MKKTKQTAFKVALALVTAFAVQSAAPAASPASPKTASLTKSSAPYELKSSLIRDTSGQQNDTPDIRLSLVNATQYALAYRWTPPLNVTFQVEYKASSDDLGKEGGWKRLTPIAAPSQFGGVTESDDHVEIERMSPGQEEELSNPSVPPAMSKEGFYRIMATLTLPGVGEFRGTVSRSTLVRSFDLVVSSKPLVIRRTAAGFAEVPAAASTAPAH